MSDSPDRHERRPNRPPGQPPKGGGDDPGGKRDDFGWKRTSRTIFFWIVFLLLVVVAFKYLSAPGGDLVEIEYTEFLQQFRQSNIKSVTFVDREMRGEFATKYLPEKAQGRGEPASKFTVVLPPLPDPNLVGKLDSAGVRIAAETSDGSWVSYLITLAPFLLIVLLWVFIMRQMQGGGAKGLFTFGKSRAKLLTEDHPKVTFADVAGAD
ncbi:MAG: ATP-dependent metallopeptidase FtsH/Yme1/Tma family protein, partial [bacterium]